MPYVKHEDRTRLDTGGDPTNAGELNYVITRRINEYLQRKGLSYAHLNEVVGVLECAKLELYRRVLSEYENTKIYENGDVYTVLAGLQD